MKESLKAKWERHYASGGFFYAVYRGFKYLIFLIRRQSLKWKKSN